MNKKVALGQFYTPKYISKAMIKIVLDLSTDSPRNVLELAAGEGELILELVSKIPLCEIYAIDIDPHNALLLKKLNPKFNVFHADATQPLNFLEGKKFQLALGNPPFLSNVVVDEHIKKLLQDSLGLKVYLNQNIRSEYIFICQYLSMLEENGLLAIVLPESIVSGSRSKKFREALLMNYVVEKVLEICGHPFDSTEAKTHILFIRKAKPITFFSKIGQLTSCNNIYSLGLVQHTLLIERMDYSYLTNIKAIEPKLRKLGDFAEVIRGKKTHKDLKLQGTAFIHTTNINDSNLFTENQFDSSAIVVNKGDLLMCRVGSRIIGKTIKYDGVSTEISDCLYVLKFYDENVQKEFLSYIRSEKGIQHIRSIARGVCSRYITKKDLLGFLF